MKKVNIAYIVPSLSSTGPVIAIRDLIDATRSFANCDVYYFDDSASKIDLNVNVFKISFFKNIDLKKYDIVHSHMLRADLYIYFNYLIFSSQRRVIFISSCHNEIKKDLTFLYGSVISKLVSPIWQFALNKFDKVIVNSERLAKNNGLKNYKIIGYIRQIKSDYVIQDIDDDTITKFVKGRKVIGFVASLIERKNHSQIFRFLKAHEGYVALLLGVGDCQEKLKLEVDKLRISSQVLFLGYKQDSRPFYKYFDLYCSPSYSEGFSLALIDAFSNNVPVALSKLGVYDELTDREDVAFFDVDNDLSMAKAIKFIAEESGKLIENANKIYIEKYSPSQVAKDYFLFYKLLLSHE